MKAVFSVDQSAGGQHVKVGMKTDVIPEGVDRRDGGKLAVRQIETSLHPFPERFDGLMEENGEQFPSLAKDAAKRLWNREDVLPMGDIEADSGRDPIGTLEHFSLVATRAVAPRFA